MEEVDTYTAVPVYETNITNPNPDAKPTSRISAGRLRAVCPQSVRMDVSSTAQDNI